MTQLAILTMVAMMMAPCSAYGESDTNRLVGDVVPPEATITIDLPDDAAGQAVSVVPETHLRSVSGVYEGMRIPLPRAAADNSCVTDVLIGISGTPSPPIELSADGRSFTQHVVSQQVETAIDADGCALVVVVAQARDHVKRRHIKRHAPRYMVPDDAPPVAPQSNSAREFENPCILYKFYSYARADLRDINVPFRRAFVRGSMYYFDQPSRNILWFWYHAEADWSASSNGYWISIQSPAPVVYRPYNNPNFWLGTKVADFGGRPGGTWTLQTTIWGRPYNNHDERCYGRPRDGYANHTVSCYTRHFLHEAFNNC